MPPPIKRRSVQSSAPPKDDGHTALREGFLVAERYGLIEPLGTGSMGTVWKARHVMLGHLVAIKFLHATIDTYPEGRTRFEREAKLSARLGEESRHICRVNDFGVIGSATPFVVMELLQGEELAVRLRRERTLPLPLIVEITRQLCRALNVAHAAGVVHRDLKPANVFLCKSEDEQSVFVKLLDFGVAKAQLEHEDSQATRAGMILGTPGYMSPEQIVGDAELDPRADLWSVAVMVYRMAVGRTPFGAGSIAELGLRILTATPAHPSKVRPELPASFDEWMLKGLAKRREDRFASATELVEALMRATQIASAYVSGVQPSPALPAEARATMRDDLAADSSVAEQRPSHGEDPTCKPIYQSNVVPRPRSLRARLSWIAAALACALVASAFMLLRSGHEHAAVPAALPTRAAHPAPAASATLEARPAQPPASPVAAPERPALPAASGSAAAPAPAAKSTDSVRAGVRKARSAETARAKVPASSVKKQASDLWNKKDEL